MRAGVLKPSFVLVRDAELQAVVLSIRGTHSFRDAFTSLTGAAPGAAAAAAMAAVVAAVLGWGWRPECFGVADVTGSPA